MKQGSNMTVSHTGMRKGISLMEMLVAIILLGILSSIGFTYYKNYYSTALAAKQIKVAVLLDQASQLKNGLELYRIKTGLDANTSQITDATDSGLGLLVAQRIITNVPATIPDMSDEGWYVETDEHTIDSTFISTQGGTTIADQYLTYDLNGTATAVADRMAYCNTLNNIASDGVTSYDITQITLLTDIGTDLNTSAETIGNTFFCYDSDNTADADGLQFVFLTRIQ